LEFEIFGLTNRFARPEDLAAAEMLWYRPYQGTSEFYLAKSRETGAAAGIVRMIRHDALRGLRSFPTVADGLSYAKPGEERRCYLDGAWLKFLEQLEPECIAELATQAVLPQYRGVWVVEHLWLEMFDACIAEGVRVWTMALVLPLFRWYRSMFPAALSAIGQTMPDYIGADSIPALLRIDHPSVHDHRRKFVSLLERRGQHAGDVREA
jgi:hypothetical protein